MLLIPLVIMPAPIIGMKLRLEKVLPIEAKKKEIATPGKKLRDFSF